MGSIASTPSSLNQGQLTLYENCNQSGTILRTNPGITNLPPNVTFRMYSIGPNTTATFYNSPNGLGATVYVINSNRVGSMSFCNNDVGFLPSVAQSIIVSTVEPMTGDHIESDTGTNTNTNINVLLVIILIVIILLLCRHMNVF